MNASLEIKSVYVLPNSTPRPTKYKSYRPAEAAPNDHFGCLILAGRRIGEPEMFVSGTELR